jgi:hypothetical protein
MARWFRSHAEKLDNPKVQRLSDAHYRAWDSLLCVACKYDGLLPPLGDIAFLLRRSEPETAELLEALMRAGLFVETEGGIAPHDWSEWQYQADLSTERVKRYRKRQRNVSASVSCNVSETASESESEADTEQSSEAKASDAPDVASLIFGRGREWLQRSTGKPDFACRSLLGKWRKIAGDEGLIAVLGRAQREAPLDAIAWIERALQASESPKATGWN